MNSQRLPGRAAIIAVLFGLGLILTPFHPTHAQISDPRLSEQDYLETIEVLDAWGAHPESFSPPVTAVIGPGNVLPAHEDLRVTIPQYEQKTSFDVQPSTSTFAGGIMHALTNNSVGIAGINSSSQFNSLGKNFYSYEAGALQDYQDVPDAIYAFDIGAAASQTQAAVNEGADILLTPVSVFENEPEVAVSTDLLASPMTTVPGTDLEVPTLLGSILEALGGWYYQRAERNTKLEEWKASHTLAAKNGRFSVAPIGDYDGTETVWPAYLSDHDIVFSVGGTTQEGTSRWSNSGLSESGTPGTGTLDIVAPAENVYSTLNSEQPGGPKYGRRNTTVGSAAMVAGVANRLKDLNSDLEGDDLRQILRRTADDIPPEGYDKETGYGRLNAKAAVDYLTERSISQGVVTGGDVTILEDGGTSFTMVASPWTDLASQKYFPDERYKVQWTIDLPEGSDHDVWVRRSGTKGWTTTNPTTGIPGATIEVRSWESEATITTYGYQGEIYDILGRLIGTYGHPVEAGDAKVAYTVATKPGTPPPPPLQASLSGPDHLQSGEYGTWTASVSGGEGSPSYDWDYSPTGSAGWQSKSCTGSSCGHTFFNGGEYLKEGSMRVTVTKGTETASTTASAYIHPPDDPECSPTDPCIAGASVTKGPAVYDLRASSQGDAVRVQWWTSGGPSAAETSPFVVQHRADSTGTWSALGDVAAADSTAKNASVSGARYQFETPPLSVGVHQFRLAVAPKGNSGSAWTSEPVRARVELEESHRLSTYPNPMRQRATVELAVKEAQAVTVRIYDVLGRAVRTLHAGPVPEQETKRLRLDASQLGLTSGTYFVRVQGETFTATRRLAVVR